ncbi:uncharacterized protein A1O9_08852 [Exophiala aquamarina CBS 119918]|uniref:polynucleotide adenylyltransferase n=1 Tax=Exophiala aquamarina CBS 119918 TaxID=1182545 RepID=A0A072P7E6_9EURO|nr:uncharacterized protein A1O9_08852 [Exophiala aquamarina CBS 119918]KEF55198.1 hypothetical protein A1O9_08852 [Exophiala aquamarina CBS 119918]
MAYGSFQRQQQSRLKILKKQSDYLMKVGQIAYETHSLRKEEVAAKEAFRQELENIAQAALSAIYPALDVSQVKLKCFGSLSNGFGLAGSDMDLLLALPDHPHGCSTHNLTSFSEQQHQAFEVDQDPEEQGFKVEARRILEKAFLDCGYGARLLTNTRVPILRVCSSPGAELLSNLRENRGAWEKTFSQSVTERGVSSPEESGTVRKNDVTADMGLIENKLTELNLMDSVNPTRTTRDNTKLEFIGDVGIPCDINFTNFVAVHNSILLRLYHDFDSRVADLGFFVKVWAKAKDINTPYRGTLSSYGYILMVLHYLMNVAKPAVIPNLQALAKVEDSWYPDRPIELYKGYDIRFLRGRKEIEEARATMTKNTQSTGELLRGFFQYYAVRDGFHWTRDVISIRERTGRVTKAQKGWTEAKWSQQEKRQVRLRYLLAIEDPFEVEHNVGRTVGHNGLVAIRDEFRKANAILEKLGTDAEVPLEEFLAPAANRGDTLRKDQEYHRQKQLQLKQELEAKEKGLMSNVSDENPDVNVDGMSGIPHQVQSQGAGCNPMHRHRGSDPKLTGSIHQGVEKKQRQPWRQRRVKIDSDSEDDDSKDSNTTRTESSLPDSDTLLLDENNTRSGVHFAPGQVSILNGFDEFGNITPWDQSTQDGRWLQWRDCKILQGKILDFREPSLRELDEQCPYDPRRVHLPSQTYRQRKEREKSVRPPWPLPDPKSKASTGSIGDASQDGWLKTSRLRKAKSGPRTRVAIEVEESKQSPGTGSITAVQTSREATPQPKEPDLLVSPNFDFVRAQRLAFFAKPESPAASVHKSNASFFLRGEPADPDNNTCQHKTSDDGPAVVVMGLMQRSSPIEHTMVSTEADCAPVSGEKSPSQQTPFNAAPSGSVTSASSPSHAPLAVPATLFSGVNRDSRPWDEDPNIMPIPQELGFEFDTRQLQDLNAIARGGNGCARDGAGFSVEQDYDWGGGGMMGYKSSTSAQQVPESDPASPYQGGKGDDEGLLAELPGALE